MTIAIPLSNKPSVEERKEMNINGKEIYHVRVMALLYMTWVLGRPRGLLFQYTSKIKFMLTFSESIV